MKSILFIHLFFLYVVYLASNKEIQYRRGHVYKRSPFSINNCNYVLVIRGNNNNKVKKSESWRHENFKRKKKTNLTSNSYLYNGNYAYLYVLPHFKDGQSALSNFFLKSKHK